RLKGVVIVCTLVFFNPSVLSVSRHANMHVKPQAVTDASMYASLCSSKASDISPVISFIISLIDKLSCQLNAKRLSLWKKRAVPVVALPLLYALTPFITPQVTGGNELTAPSPQSAIIGSAVVLY